MFDVTQYTPSFSCSMKHMAFYIFSVTESYRKCFYITRGNFMYIVSVDKIRELFWKLLSLCNALCLAAMWVYLFEVHWCWNFENNKYTKCSVTWNYHGRRIVHLSTHTWVWNALFAMLWDSLQLLHTAIWPISWVWMLSFTNAW